tara:strand:+ start:809 stop:2299 length:1491 start_codon:yes stop_codon:yes gene_type:complete
MPGTTDTVKAILTPGEFVIRKEAVDMIGVPTLEKLNDMPEAGGHSEIDRLIAQATLKNMTGMYGGGMVNAKKYGHGGMVNKYEDGGQAMSNLKPVPNNNPGLAKLPEDVRNKMGYMQEGGSVLDMALRRAEPMQLNPEFVNVDYELKEDPSGSSANIQNLGYFLDLQRKYTDEANIYRKALEPFNKAQYEGLGKPVEAIEEWAKKVNPDIGDEGDARDKLLFRKLKQADKKLQQSALTSNRQMGQMIYQANQDKPIVGNFDQPLKDYTKASKEFEGLLREIIRRPIASKVLDESFDNSSREYYNKFGNPFFGDYDTNATGERYDMQNPKRFLDYRDQPVLDVFEDGGLIGMMHGGKAKKKKKMYGYQEGGAVQEDAMMQDYLQSLQAQRANPFIPFDQRPPSSGEVMSSTPKGMEQGDYYMSLKNELEMENEELLRDKVQNTFDRIRLDSLYNQGAEYIERRPDDSLSFPNTPEQDYFMKKYREQMIDPMFLPQDN